MALLHLEQVAVAVRDPCEIERIAARRGSHTDAQRVEQLARARFVDAGHAFRRVANPFILKQRAECGGWFPQQLGAGVPDVLAADVLAVAAALYARELGGSEGDHRAVASAILVITGDIFIERKSDGEGKRGT